MRTDPTQSSQLMPQHCQGSSFTRPAAYDNGSIGSMALGVSAAGMDCFPGMKFDVSGVNSSHSSLHNARLDHTILDSARLHPQQLSCAAASTAAGHPDQTATGTCQGRGWPAGIWDLSPTERSPLAEAGPATSAITSPGTACHSSGRGASICGCGQGCDC